MNNNENNYSNNNLNQYNALHNQNQAYHSAPQYIDHSINVNHDPYIPQYNGQSNQQQAFNNQYVPPQMNAQYLQQQQQQQQNQQYNNQYQQYQQQPRVALVNTQVNLGGIGGVEGYYTNPEHVYCTANIKDNQKKTNHAIGFSGITTALQQVQNQQNLDFRSLELIGSLNLFSTSQFVRKVLDPIILNNPQVPSWEIKQGKVFYCCKFLFKKIKKYSILLQLMIIFSLLALAVGYYILLIDEDISFVTLLYGIQFISYFLQMFILLPGVMKCKLSILKGALFFAVINITLGLVCIAVTKIRASHGSSSLRDNFTKTLIMEIPPLIIGSYTIFLYSGVRQTLKRLLVLLKQLDESEFSKSACI